VQLGPELHHTLVKRFEVDLFGFERFNRKSLCAVEEWFKRGGGIDDIGFSGQLRHNRQVKIATYTINARNHQTDHGTRAQNPGGAGKPPRRAGQVNVQPLIFERCATCGDALLQPSVPDRHEPVTHAATQKIAMARQLAVETHFHYGCSIGH
jgi:hypothetical protein